MLTHCVTEYDAPATSDRWLPVPDRWTLTRSSTWVSRTCYFLLSGDIWLISPAGSWEVVMETSANGRWCGIQLTKCSTWFELTLCQRCDVDVSAMCVGLCCWFIGGHLVCDWRPCSKQTTTQTYTWQGRGASPIDRSTWAPAPCVSLIIAVAVNIDPFTSRSVDTAARAFVFIFEKRKSYQRTY